MTDHESTILKLFSFVAELTKKADFYSRKALFLSRIALFLKQNMRGSGGGWGSSLLYISIAYYMQKGVGGFR